MLTLLLVLPGIPLLLRQRAGKARLDTAQRLSNQTQGSISFSADEQKPSDLPGKKSIVKSVAAMAGFYPASSLPLLILWAVPLSVALAGVAYLALVRGDQVCRLFGLVALSVGVGVVALRVNTTRHILPLVPILAVALARVVQYWAARVRLRSAGLIIGTLILGLYVAGFFRQAFVHHGRPWQNLVGVVQQNYRPGDEVIFDVLYAQIPFDYFARQVHFRAQETGFPLSIYDWWDKQEFKGWGGPVIMQADLDRLALDIQAQRPNTIWLVLDETYYYDPHNALLARLRRLGQVDESRLPPDPDNPDAEGDESLHLFRLTLN
jgi:hypothetical protein